VPAPSPKPAAPAPAPTPAPVPAPSPTKPVATKEVVILNLSDLTGPTASNNLPVTAMMEMWVKHVNEVKGGLFGKKGGVKLKLEVADTHYAVARAKEAWARARDMGMITGFHNMSGLAEGLVVDAERDKIPLVCGSWGLKAPWSEWMYGTTHPGLPDTLATEGILQAREIAKATGKPAPTKIGTMCSAAPFEPMFFFGNADWIKQQGITLSRESFPMGAPDVSVNLLRLKDAGVQSIYFICSVADMVTANKDLKRIGWDVEVHHSVCSAVADLAAIGGWDLIEGRYFCSTYTPIDTESKYQGPGHKLIREIAQKYRPTEPVRDYYIFAMTGCLIIQGAIEKALDEITPDKLNGEALKTYGLDRLNNLDMMGLTYNVSYAPGNDHPGPNRDRVFLVKKGLPDGKITPVADWIEFTKIKPKP